MQTKKSVRSAQLRRSPAVEIGDKLYLLDVERGQFVSAEPPHEPLNLGWPVCRPSRRRMDEHERPCDGSEGLRGSNFSYCGKCRKVAAECCCEEFKEVSL